MNPNPFFGVVLHAIGGLAAASFYIPFKRVRKWAWESYWIVGGLFGWIISPWVVSYLVCGPCVMSILRGAPIGSLVWTFIFGVLWGVGAVTFGLSMRYLGLSLGYAMALGFCAAFGTIVPPIYMGQFGGLISSTSGLITLLGVLVCLAGIAICGKAGLRKEGELSADQKKASISEFNFFRGLWVAVLAGVMSACMAFALQAGKPIAALAAANGTPELWKNSPVYILAFGGGFTTNVVWCVFLNIRNRSAKDYISSPDTSLLLNYVFSALAGIVWYMQFMFYGMGTTQMGRYDFSSWTIHMAFIIVFSNLWGLAFHEWKGTSRKTHNVVFAGILVLVLSTIVVGLGSYLKN